MSQLDYTYAAVTMIQKEYHRQAELHRLMELIGEQQPSRVRQLMAWTGRQLIVAGERLQSRATPSTPVVACSDGFC